MKPEDQMREAWDNAILPNTAIVRLAFEDGYRAAEKALAHRDAQPAVAVGEQLLEALTTAFNGLQWYHIEYPDTVAEADYEAMEEIKAAIVAAEQMKGGAK